VNKTGTYVLLANFMSGSICVLPIREDGHLDDSSDVIQHHGSSIDSSRQQGPHAHAVVLDPTNRYAFVPDLGLDKTMIYKFDSNLGKLTPHEPPWVEATPGAGPRHLAFHPNGRYVYLINELNSSLSVYDYDTNKAALTKIQTVPTLPPDFQGPSTCADLHVLPAGTFVYGSNRGHDSIVIYRIDQHTGRLSTVDHQSTQGKTPRNFAIDPSGTFLLVGNQDSDTIVTFRIDPQTGRLRATGQVTDVPTPVCVKIIVCENP
jgi:6-phosphogluconolactonase